MARMRSHITRDAKKKTGRHSDLSLQRYIIRSDCEMGELNRTCSGSHGEPEEKMHIEQASRELNEQSLHATHENTLDRHDPHVRTARCHSSLSSTITNVFQNWSRLQKIYITGLISILALAGQCKQYMIL